MSLLESLERQIEHAGNADNATTECYSPLCGLTFRWKQSTTGNFLKVNCFVVLGLERQFVQW